VANAHHANSTIVAREEPGTVWRVGYGPEPWDWTGWVHASHGHFDGRWDALDGAYRTIYAGSTLFTCLVEVLARFRVDPVMALQMNDIVEDESDRALHATAPAGVVDPAWFSVRRAGQATLHGKYCDVTHSSTISTLRPAFIRDALELGLDDFDASALQNSRPRELTQKVGRAIYRMSDPEGNPSFDGVHFRSRHGNELELWAVFERADDGSHSSRLEHIEVEYLDIHSTAVQSALALHSLRLG
jgi:hypothetical protein